MSRRMRGSETLRKVESAVERAARGLTFWSFFLFGLFLFFVAQWVPAEKRFHKMGRREHRLRAEEQRLSREARDLSVRLRAIRTDRYYIERLLREQQGLSGEGELVVRSRLRVIAGE